MEYDQQNPESLMHKYGQVALIVHKDQLGRDEKDVVRAATSDPSSCILPVGNSHFVLFIARVPDEDLDNELESSEADVEPVEPTHEDELHKLTIAQLKELASTEEIPIYGLTVKADLVGRISAVREQRDN